MTDNFRTSFRGYDPADIDPLLAKLRADAADATAKVGAAQVGSRKLSTANEELIRDVDGFRNRIAELEYEITHRPAPTFADLGNNIGSMLSLAEEEAAALRTAAEEGADLARNDAAADAHRMQSEADVYATEVRSRTDAEAAVILAKARREVDDMLDFADRESQARREEAEALYERQRAESTTAAADFERTLAERRENVAAVFTAQMEEHDRVLAESVTRRNEAETEAKRMLDDALHQSRNLVESAQEESAQIVTHARAQADRIKTESQRELAAATARRDSISSQLANVRQMIGTLGGSPALLARSEQGQLEADSATAVVETVDAELVADDDVDAEDAEFVEVGEERG